MTSQEKNRRRGSAILEFTLAGLPMLFMLVATFELARGMWVYHTVSGAAREGAHYATRHANQCTQHGNTCAATLQSIGQAITQFGMGVIPADTVVILSGSSAPTIGPIGLDSMLTSTQYWPTISATQPSYPGGKIGEDLQVEIRYRFQSAIVVFFPGSADARIPTFWMSAASREAIQF